MTIQAALKKSTKRRQNWVFQFGRRVRRLAICFSVGVKEAKAVDARRKTSKVMGDVNSFMRWPH
jgi:hypothetical protein